MFKVPQMIPMGNQVMVHLRKDSAGGWGAGGGLPLRRAPGLTPPSNQGRSAFLFFKQSSQNPASMAKKNSANTPSPEEGNGSGRVTGRKLDCAQRVRGSGQPGNSLEALGEARTRGMRAEENWRGRGTS